MSEHKKMCYLKAIDQTEGLYEVIENQEIPVMEIMYHRDKYPGILELTKYGNFIDVRSAITADFKKGESTLIPLGFSAKIPDGYWAQIVPRSSSFKKYKFIETNSFGVIDSTYCGPDDEWKLPVYFMEDTHINFNDRIAQFRLVEDINFNIKEVEKLDGENRGGFGSTGEK